MYNEKVNIRIFYLLIEFLASTGNSDAGKICYLNVVYLGKILTQLISQIEVDFICDQAEGKFQRNTRGRGLREFAFHRREAKNDKKYVT